MHIETWPVANGSVDVRVGYESKDDLELVRPSSKITLPNRRDSFSSTTSEKSKKTDADDYAVVRKHKLEHYGGMTIILVFAYASVVCALGTEITLPPGPLWAVLYLYVCTLAAGMLCDLLKIPSLLGMIFMGILLQNLPSNEVLLNLGDETRIILNGFGLFVIFLRSGLELDVAQLSNHLYPTIRLIILPSLAESFVCAGVLVAMFDMPLSFALSIGFILASSSPAVIVPAMFDLNIKGYGTAKGIPNLVVAAASFDDIMALTGFAVAISVALENSENGFSSSPYAIIVELTGAVILALAGSLLASATKLFSSTEKRTGFLFAWGLFVIYLAKMLAFESMGAISSLTLGVVTARFWAHPPVPSWALGPDESFHHESEHIVARVWTWAAKPFVYGLIGASIDFSELSTALVLPSFLVVCSGVAVRLPVAYLVLGTDFNPWERGFVALSWAPKATVQAILGPAPLLLVESMGRLHPTYSENYYYAEIALVTSVLAILLTAPLGGLLIQYLGPRWLAKDAPHEPIHPEVPHKRRWERLELSKRIQHPTWLALNETYIATFFVQLTDAVDKLSAMALEGVDNCEHVCVEPVESEGAEAAEHFVPRRPISAPSSPFPVGPSVNAAGVLGPADVGNARLVAESSHIQRRRSLPSDKSRREAILRATAEVREGIRSLRRFIEAQAPLSSAGRLFDFCPLFLKPAHKKVDAISGRVRASSFSEADLDDEDLIRLQRRQTFIY